MDGPQQGSCEEGQRHTPGLTSGDLHTPLEAHMLPRLGIRDLIQLSLTCKAVHVWLHGVNASIWAEAAAPQLPFLHPALPKDAWEVRRAVQRNHTVMQNIRQGTVTKVRHIGEAYRAASSPSRAIFALADVGDKEGTCKIFLFDGRTGDMHQTCFVMPWGLGACWGMSFIDEQTLSVLGMVKGHIPLLEWFLVDIKFAESEWYSHPFTDLHIGWEPNMSPYLSLNDSPYGYHLAVSCKPGLWQILELETNEFLSNVPYFAGWENIWWSMCGQYVVSPVMGPAHECALFDMDACNATMLQNTSSCQISPDSTILLRHCDEPYDSSLSIHSFSNGVVGDMLLQLPDPSGPCTFSADSSLMVAEYWETQYIICRTSASCAEILARMLNPGSTFIDFAPTEDSFALLNINRDAVVLYSIQGAACIEVGVLGTLERREGAKLPAECNQYEGEGTTFETNFGWGYDFLLAVSNVGKSDEDSYLTLFSFAPTSDCD